MARGLRPRGVDDSKVNSVRTWAEVNHGSLFIDDATGFVSATTPTAEVIDAAPVTVGFTSGMTGAVATGSLTVSRAGRYRASVNLGSVLSGNASVVTVELYKNAAVLAATAAAGGAAKCILTMAGTAVVMSGGIVPCLTTAVPGDVYDVRVTGTVGTITIKNYRFELVQVDDGDPASAV